MTAITKILERPPPKLRDFELLNRQKPSTNNEINTNKNLVVDRKENSDHNQSEK